MKLPVLLRVRSLVAVCFDKRQRKNKTVDGLLSLRCSNCCKSFFLKARSDAFVVRNCSLTRLLLKVSRSRDSGGGRFNDFWMDGFKNR